MMRVLLRGKGYEVKLASTGGEAIEIARIFRPAVVLIDLVLPDMNGAELAGELGTIVGFEKVSAVAVSGYGSKWIPKVFDGHFVIPVDHDALGGFLSQMARPGETLPDGATALQSAISRASNAPT
jgi:two-component system CheB/CheR fusion protein